MTRELSKETLDQLAIYADRHDLRYPTGDRHNYHGDCPWCRGYPHEWVPDSEELFMRGGSHEWAAALIAEVQRLRSLVGVVGEPTP